MKEKSVLSLSYGRIVVKPVEKLHGLVPKSFETYQIVDPGDIIIRSTDLQNDWNSLRVGLVKNRGIITAAYLCLRTTKVLTPEYGYNLLHALDVLKVFYGMGSGLRQNLSYQDFKRMPLLLPPVEEQAAIVRFLDHANRRIDSFIRAKRKLIALLNEQKQAIIHRAVTRGLNSNVSFKQSGLPWLGHIPMHWQSLQVRRVTSFVTSGSRSWAKHYSDDGFVFVQSGNLGRSMSLKFDYVQHVRPPSGAEGERTRIQCDDVLVFITGALTGNVVHVTSDPVEPSFVNQHVALIRPRTKAVHPRFLAYALHSEIGRGQFKTSEYGGTKQGLSLQDVKSVFVPAPPLDGQESIVASLDRSLRIFDHAIKGAAQEITLLREHGTRLTADIVTGKLDVRDAAARLPEMPTENVAERAVSGDEEAGELEGANKEDQVS